MIRSVLVLATRSRAGWRAASDLTPSRAIHRQSASYVLDRDATNASSLGMPDLNVDDVTLEGARNVGGFLTPTVETLDTVVAGTKYTDLPIVYIKSTKNNTIVTMVSQPGETRVGHSSGGVEGFKNARKGTNVAAQSAGLTVGQLGAECGLYHARVVVRGFGPGRMSAMKGLQMGGLQIVSITDATRLKFTNRRSPRPRKL